MSWASEQNLLLERGHEVFNYTRDNREVERLASWKTGLRTVWSGEDYHSLRETIRQHRPDVMTIHNFFPLISPAAYYAARAEGVPVVQTLHNYRLLCLGAYFFREGKVCEDCLGKSVPWPGVFHGCYRQNRIVSGVVASMLTAHQTLNTWRRMVDIYVALTDFSKAKFIEGGLPADKIVVKPNFVHPDPGLGSGDGGYALYVGRLSAEKGLDTMMAAWKELGQSIPLKIVGEGPLADRVTQAAHNNSAIEYLGARSRDEVIEMLRHAACLVLPSRWYEGLPMTIIESFAVGTPVIASALGSMSSLVDHARTGLHFRAGDVVDLIRQVKWIISHPDELAQMRQAARAEFETKYTAEKNHEALMQIYTLAQHRTRHR
ncbi:MAG TPA: glycosyltransferase family 4 protein [Blastocatellia bacterium]|nr:glycosyltransferase family 4 protein [Blastocatellia bacterium]